MINFKQINGDNYNEQFEKFKEKIKDELNTIWQLLEIRMSDELGELKNQLSDAEVWYHRVIYFLADADGFYNKAKLLRLPPKIKEMTEMDRKILIDDLVSDEKNYRDKLEGLLQSIEQRIILGQSYLKAQKPFSSDLIGDR